MILKDNRINSPRHRRFVAEQPCFIDKYWDETCIDHHLLRAHPIKGTGKKSCDIWCLPLRNKRHDELHACGDEEAFFKSHGYTYEEVKQHCIELAKRSPCKKIRDRVNQWIRQNKGL